MELPLILVFDAIDAQQQTVNLFQNSLLDQRTIMYLPAAVIVYAAGAMQIIRCAIQVDHQGSQRFN